MLIGILALTLLGLAACTSPAAQAPVTGTDAGGAATVPSMSEMDPSTMGQEEMDHGSMAAPAQPFDLGFIDSMIEHHEGAVAMAQQALEQPNTRNCVRWRKA